MTDRDEGLARIRAEAGGIDPQIDQALNYGKGVRAVQQVVRQQGHVMSAALANNEQLYHTNKKLTAELKEARRRVEALTRQCQHFEVKVAELESEAALFTAANAETVELVGTRAANEQLRAHNAFLVETLQAYLYAELDQDGLREKLESLKVQAKEIEAMPDRATPEEIGRIADGTTFEDELGPERLTQALE